MPFRSYFWQDAEFDEPELAGALAELVEPASAVSALEAFRVLMNSDDVAAAGIALDQYQSAEAGSRWGIENPFASEASTVLRRARDLLEQDPVRQGEFGARVRGANHASALVAMTNLAEAADAVGIAKVIDQATDTVVRSVAFNAAERAADEARQVDEPWGLDVLVGALSRGLDNLRWPSWDRADALRVLAVAAPPLAVEKAHALLHAPALDLQTRAAWVLAELNFDASRNLLAEVAESWPDDAPYPAFEVRQVLDEVE